MIDDKDEFMSTQQTNAYANLNAFRVWMSSLLLIDPSDLPDQLIAAGEHLIEHQRPYDQDLDFFRRKV